MLSIVTDELCKYVMFEYCVNTSLNLLKYLSTVTSWLPATNNLCLNGCLSNHEKNNLVSLKLISL